MTFFNRTLKEVFSNISNDYNDNWDYVRFGKMDPIARNNIRGRIQKLLNKRGYYHTTRIESLITGSQQINKFEYLYNHLESEEDRKLLLQVLAYRVLGHRKVKLPLNTPDYWVQLKSLQELEDKTDYIDPVFMDFILHKMDLHKIGYPIKFYFTAGGILTDFIIKQYEYNRNGNMIKAEKGDIVIDGGGCWGDTALYFANEVGKEGKVFSFEFIPNNIKIFNKNISLNQELKERIELVPHPLWKDSSTKIFFKDYGPGSKVSLDKFNDPDGECYTKSIDDFVMEEKPGKVDFIKMDIEGAETNALKGAARTIIESRPKLAIALYHSADDFERIPSMIKELVPDYKFYFSHCTIHEEESILFATTN
jgi:FkbM family methyltransferase